MIEHWRRAFIGPDVQALAPSSNAKVRVPQLSGVLAAQPFRQALCLLVARCPKVSFFANVPEYIH